MNGNYVIIAKVNWKVNHLPFRDYCGQYNFNNECDVMAYLDIFISIIALIILEIVLGIDNLVFLSILTEKLPIKERRQAQR